jgi:mannose-6-phosphate isomerase-like protein (cupin superfamily)
MDIVDVTAHKGESSSAGEDERRTGPGRLVVIPAGARHHVRNPGRVPLFVLTVYAPPES